MYIISVEKIRRKKKLCCTVWELIPGREFENAKMYHCAIRKLNNHGCEKSNFYTWGTWALKMRKSADAKTVRSGETNKNEPGHLTDTDETTKQTNWLVFGGRLRYSWSLKTGDNGYVVYFEPGKWTCNTRLAGMVSSLVTHVRPFLIGGAPKLHR